MLHWIRLSTAKWAAALALATAAGLTLISCGGGGGGGTNVGIVDPGNNGGNATTCTNAVSPAGLQVITLQAGSERICAEVASTPEQREQGLMGRQGLAANSGMLFVFSEPTTICMWMQDTTIPLSVAFIDQDGIILNITDMTPLTTDLHCSASPARFALEMNQGWFGQKNIMPGSRITGLP